MRHLQLGLAFTLLVASLPASASAPRSTAQGIYFDDSGPRLMRLGNAFYEVGLRKDNGGIEHIIDKETGQTVTNGSLNGCLWVIVYDYSVPNEYIESCNYRPESPNRFSYVWSPADRKLVMHYDPDPAAPRSVRVTVTLTASLDNWFDLHLLLDNRWGGPPDDVKFPADLVFDKGPIREVLLPVLPGVVLNSGFFQGTGFFEENYPGLMVSDFVAIAATTGRFAMYSIAAKDRVVPVRMGFSNCVNSASTCFLHNLKSGIADGATWSSPTIRIRVAESHYASIRAFRSDNHFDDFASVRDKLDTLYEQVVQLPLYKADFGMRRFAEYAGFLNAVPYPGILHMVAYWQGNAHGVFDENYPDFQSPNPDLGTAQEMVDMMHQVQGMGYLVMPYINPTWWDDESPTLQNLPHPWTIEDIAVLNRQLSPEYEYYAWHGGYVVSPHAEFVQQRLDQLMTQMKVLIPSDLIHEDQVGGRSSRPDYNAASPDPAAYCQGWFNHTRTYSDLLLTCENGYDRLAATETGFHGSVLLAMEEGKTDPWWGAGNWRLYPFAPIVVRDKVLLYHNTEGRSSTDKKGVLSLNLAFGYMLSYDLGALGRDNPWLRVAGAYQAHVLSRYADEQMTGYEQLAPGVTRSDFEHTSVVMNWNQSSAYTTGGYVLPPEGALLQNKDGSLTAGIFTTYNGVPLSNGDHYLIEERGADSIIIYQPLGPDTPLTLDLLPGWAEGDPIQVWAYTAQGQAVASMPITVAPQGLNFSYQQEIGGHSVAFYQAFRPHQLFLPVTRKGY